MTPAKQSLPPLLHPTHHRRHFDQRRRMLHGSNDFVLHPLCPSILSAKSDTPMVTRDDCGCGTPTSCSARTESPDRTHTQWIRFPTRAGPPRSRSSLPGHRTDAHPPPLSRFGSSSRTASARCAMPSSLCMHRADEADRSLHTTLPHRRQFLFVALSVCVARQTARYANPASHGAARCSRYHHRAQ